MFMSSYHSLRQVNMFIMHYDEGIHRKCQKIFMEHLLLCFDIAVQMLFHVRALSPEYGRAHKCSGVKAYIGEVRARSECAVTFKSAAARPRNAIKIPALCRVTR